MLLRCIPPARACAQALTLGSSSCLPQCWYLNNCAGQANLRQFLLFLFYVVAVRPFDCSGVPCCLPCCPAVAWHGGGSMRHVPCAWRGLPAGCVSS